MKFRSRLAAVIFAVGLIPSLLVIFAAAYLLRSGIDRVASSGLESSLASAEELVEGSQQAAGALMAQLLRDRLPFANSAEAEAWLAQNRLDLAFENNRGNLKFAVSDSIFADSGLISQCLRLKPGISVMTIDSRDFLIYTTDDSVTAGGRGILLPEGYATKGKALSRAVSVSASLGLMKTFSARLLIVIAATAMGLSIVLAVITSGILSQRLSRPLAELTRSAEIIGQGNLGHRVVLSGSDEFARLGESFNGMALNLSENQRRLLEAERLAAWREVARRIAHEIRNPLTPVAIHLHRLEQELIRNPDSGNSLEAIQAIRIQLNALQELARQFSTFAKEPELHPVRCSLVEIVENAIRASGFGPALKVTMEIESPIPNLSLDPQMMGRAIANLLKNSHEALPDGGEVHIAIRCSASALELTIRDNGPGFPPEKLAHIDQPYITTKPTGTGLGLVIVKKIIEEHGGSIEFSNDGGAVIRISLPHNST